MIHDTQKSGLEIDKTWLTSPTLGNGFSGSPVFAGSAPADIPQKKLGFRENLALKRRKFLLFLHARLYDKRFEKLLFVPSQGQARQIALDMGSEKSEPRQQEVVPVKVVEWSLSALPPQPHGMYFVDFDAGRGQRVLIASTREFERIVCSESANDLHDDAQMNIAQFPRSYMSCRSVDLVCAPALKLAIPDKDAAFMFFRPRGLADMRLQIDRIITAYRAAPRRFYILTVDADAQQHDLIMSSGVFQVQRYSPFARLKHKLFSPYRLKAYRTIV